MELHQALKHIIKAEGQDIVTDLRLVNILNDLNAYQDIQGSKYMIRAIIDDGFSLRFKQIGALNASANDLIRKFYTTTGFNADAVTKIFQSIAFGLGWISQMPSTSPQPTPAPAPVPSPQPQPNPAASKLNLTYSQLEKKSDAFKHQYAQDAEQYLDGIIHILGNPQRELGVSNLNVNCSFSGEYNNFDLNIEVEGGIKTTFQYNLVFTIILKSPRGKIISKEEIYVDKKAAKNPYFVETVQMIEDEFHRVCDIAEIKIYWRKD